MIGAFWTADFEIRRDHLTVRKTGAVVRYNLAVGKEVLDWFLGYLAAQGLRAGALLSGRPPLKVAFVPDEPRPWYLVWSAARAAGCRFVKPVEADLVFFFNDATTEPAPSTPARLGAGRVNMDCADVSKTKVAQAFEAVFGYPLAVDPATWTGPMVEKSELNGAHDGRIVQGPRAALPGHAYQRVIETTAEDGLVTDLRCPTVAGEIPIVFAKRRAAAHRFANENDEVILHEPDAVLSGAERALLARFARAMNLDWGGIDVLRDRRDGRIYVVDVNKTDMGPPTALPLPDKITAIKRLAAAFRDAFSSASP